MTGQPTDFERLGGEAALRAIVDRFVNAVFDDVMIGFHFRAASRERVKAKEYELAANHLGARVPYTGRPLPEAHAAHPILRGQFERRMKLLEETLATSAVPPAIRDRWLDHDRALLPVVVREPDAPCDAALRRRLPPAQGPWAQRPE